MPRNNSDGNRVLGWFLLSVGWGGDAEKLIRLVSIRNCYQNLITLNQMQQSFLSFFFSLAAAILN